MTTTEMIHKYLKREQEWKSAGQIANYFAQREGREEKFCRRPFDQLIKDGLVESNGAGMVRAVQRPVLGGLP